MSTRQPHASYLIPNDRYWKAITALISADADCRGRVVLALQILESLRIGELDDDLQARLDEVRKKAKTKGCKIVNGVVVEDAYTNTANGRQNKTYAEYAKEIFRIYEELWARYAYKEIKK